MERDFSKKSMFSYNKHLRYVSSSIPLACSVALLLLTICIISPDGFGVGSSSSVYAEEDSFSSSTSNSAADDAGIATAAEIQSPTASASLSIEGDLEQTTSAGMGNGPAFRSHNVSISTTDITEYSLRISYANGSDSLQYYGNTSTPQTNGTTIAGANGVAASSMNDNTWGYAWNTNTDVSPEEQTYYTMPAYNSTGSGIANGELLPMSSTNPKQGKIMFAAKFGDNAIAGHYKTAVLLSLIATPQTITVTDYNISFECKGGSNCPTNVSITESREPIYTYTISTTEPTRTNYTFLGYTTDSAATVADANYAPGKTITISSSSPSLTLYAVWKSNEPAVTGFGGIKKMQDMSSTICNSVSNGATGQLYDTRDNSTYTIAKLDDGKCWMTQNLRLVSPSEDNKITLTSSDSNLAEGATYAIPASSEPWVGNESGSFDFSLEKVHYADNKTNGAYYTWCASTASKGRYCDGATTTSDNSEYSICPRGWKLPTKAQYDALLSKGYGDKSTIAANKGLTIGGGFFPAAGVVFTGSLTGVGSEGSYWSSTAYITECAYYLSFNTGYVFMDNYNLDRHHGFPIRCIAP